MIAAVKSRLGGERTTEEDEFECSCCNDLTYKQRLIGFAVCLVLGNSVFSVVRGHDLRFCFSVDPD